MILDRSFLEVIIPVSMVAPHNGVSTMFVVIVYSHRYSPEYDMPTVHGPFTSERDATEYAEEQRQEIKEKGG